MARFSAAQPVREPEQARAEPIDQPTLVDAEHGVQDDVEGEPLHAGQDAERLAERPRLDDARRRVAHHVGVAGQALPRERG